jgi:hypothetical protein
MRTADHQAMKSKGTTADALYSECVGLFDAA